MFVRIRFLSAAAAGLWMALPLPGQEPARLELERAQTAVSARQVSANQLLANAVADQLRQARLQNFDIDISARDGIVELTGTVTDAAQKQEALRAVQGTTGVLRVVDRIVSTMPLTQVQAVVPPQPQEIAPQPAPVQIYPPAMPPAANYSGAIPQLNLAPTQNGMVAAEPVPLGGPSMAPNAINPPPLPPYAWPTYAPYNNYSRVAYPEAYPYQAFPFIGPFYPFPKVPLGWRSVKLEWQDGHWWYSKVATNYDWWRVRYW